MILIIVLSMGWSVILIILNSTISKKKIMEREAPSAFECGFEPKSSARMPFSLRFYLIASIFLIFDVEIVLLIPVPIIYNISNILVLTMLTWFFISILMIGLYHEWNQGALEWDK
uniref:NADH-ubiquinone oxidoreductase chain 3 n=1 Tax=Folsomotoma octooculata TaxID=1334185 RepID=A0A059PIL8_9HEXA|nr:NADH dehydrogenase subunit 3 [Folsomotoma octooculata]AGL95077.1 NADH dehydrogenase subunit 3 [Folsomotoma octooculata]